MRRMLNGILLDGEGGRGLAGAHATEALEGFLERAERPSASHRFPESYTVERDEVYEDHAWHFGQGSSVGRALKYLLDTNVLVYALERGEPRKREWAVEVIRRLGRAGGRRVASSSYGSSPAPV